MEFTCNKADLLKAIQVAEKGVSPKSTLPILGNISFLVKDNILKITSTNLAIGIEVKVKVVSISDGAILINAKTISNIINKMPDQEINISTLENNTVQIKCAKSNFTINGLAYEDFPNIPRLDNEKRIVINKEELKDLVRQTIIAVSIDETKSNLNGIYFQIEKNAIIGVAIDGFRLASKKIAGDFAEQEDKKIIIPTKAMHELLSFFNSFQYDTVSLSCSDNLVVFEYGDIYLSAMLIKESFPEYEKVIPTDFNTRFVVNKDDFVSALDRCSIIASLGNNNCRLEVMENNLIVKANIADLGNVSEMLDIDKNDQVSLKVSVNIRLMLDALKVITQEKVQLSFIDFSKPIEILPVSDSETFKYIVMPIRTPEMEQ